MVKLSLTLQVLNDLRGYSHQINPRVGDSLVSPLQQRGYDSFKKWELRLLDLFGYYLPLVFLFTA